MIVTGGEDCRYGTVPYDFTVTDLFNTRLARYFVDFWLNGCPGSCFFLEVSGASIPTSRMVIVDPLPETLVVSPSVTLVSLN